MKMKDRRTKMSRGARLT